MWERVSRYFDRGDISRNVTDRKTKNDDGRGGTTLQLPTVFTYRGWCNDSGEDCSRK